MAEIQSISIGPYRIGPDHSPLVIAEAAVNHQGDFETAKRMVYIAHAMGAHIIKVKLPTDHLDLGEAKKVYESYKIPRATLTERVQHVVAHLDGRHRAELDHGRVWRRLVQH